MRSTALLLAAAALAAAVPGHAQTTGPCRPTVEETAPPRTPADSALDAFRAAVRDSLRVELLRAAQNAGVVAPAGIVLVELRPESGARRSWTYGANVPDAVFAPVIAARADALSRLYEPRVKVTSFRLDRVDPPEEPATECLPRLTNPQQFARELDRVARRFTVAHGENTQVSLMVQMLVTRDGEVAHAMITRGATGTDLDREVLARARRLRFLPAALDDVRVDVWVEQPVTMQLPQARRRDGLTTPE